MAIGLIALLLLSPEINEFTAFGVSIKRRVEQTQRAVEAAREDLGTANATIEQTLGQVEETRSLLSQQIQQIQELRLQVANSASASVGDIFIGGQAVKEAGESLDEKVEQVWRGGGTLAGPIRSEEDVPVADLFQQTPSLLPEVESDRAVKMQRLIRSWELVGRTLGLPGTLGARQPVLDPDTRGRFLAVFAEEIEIVRAARNAAAHGAPLDDELLTTAVEMAEKLEALLRDAVAHRVT